MSYTSEWQIPDRVILFQLGDTYTLEDAGRLNSHMLNLLNQSTQLLHMLVDLVELRHYPLRLTEEVWAITLCLRHPQMGWLMVVNNGTNPMALFIASVVSKTTGVKMRFVKSQEEAMEILRRMDLTLQAA